jgi:hypothetical protein
MSGTITSHRQQIRAALILAIASGQTAAGASVFGPRDWPTSPEKLPCIIAASPPRERAESLVRGRPSYETTGLFPITARVAGTSIESVDNQLETIIVQIKTAVFSNQAFLDLIERVSFIETTTTFTSDSKNHIGEAVIVFGCEFPEFYSPSPGVPLTEFQATITDQTTGEQIGSFDVKLEE